MIDLNKTDIMISNTKLKNIKPDFAFDFGGVSIAPVDTPNHLGVTFSSEINGIRMLMV